jgi:hypothetical protein
MHCVEINCPFVNVTVVFCKKPSCSFKNVPNVNDGLPAEAVNVNRPVDGFPAVPAGIVHVKVVPIRLADLRALSRNHTI